MAKLKEDQVVAIILAVLTAVYWADIRSLATLRSDDPVGPTGFPTIISISSFVLCAILFVRPQKDMSPIEHGKTALWYWFLLFLYVLGIPYAGFVVSTAIFLAATLFSLRIRLVPLLISVVLITAASYLIFHYIFDLKLTIGPWG
jgi:hypothetical protein